MPDTTLRHVPGMKAAAAVPSRAASELSQEAFLAEYVSRSQPVLIKGAVSHWPARQKWRDKEYLKRRSEHHEVFFYPHENHVSAPRQEANERLMGFGEAIDALTAPETRIGFVGTATPIELLADVGDFSFFAPEEPAFFYPDIRYFLFRDAGTTWHYHPFDETLMCQVIGAKRVGLLHTLSPRPHAVRDIFFAEDYYDDPKVWGGFDDSGHRWLEAIVEEGDALYIPPLWWHGVVPLSGAFGVTAAVPWRSPPAVIAEGIAALASGQVAIVGSTPAPKVQALVDVAKALGLEQEFAKAWQQKV